ncbi:hypothetical protein CASFOL_033107 [Castilleja foliolosa]|uniref:Uncharacterized protein n=1 Tax=Castilleja foliolosa TaxID=1961234 RepID=A0ABD3C3D9_9LAMI
MMIRTSVILCLCLFSMQWSLHHSVNAMGLVNRRLQMEIKEIHHSPLDNTNIVSLYRDYSVLPGKRRSVHNDLKP